MQNRPLKKANSFMGLVQLFFQAVMPSLVSIYVLIVLLLLLVLLILLAIRRRRAWVLAVWKSTIRLLSMTFEHIPPSVCVYQSFFMEVHIYIPNFIFIFTKSFKIKAVVACIICTHTHTHKIYLPVCFGLLNVFFCGIGIIERSLFQM